MKEAHTEPWLASCLMGLRLMACCATAVKYIIPVGWCGAMLGGRLVAEGQSHQLQGSQAGPAASVICKLEAPA